MRQRSFAWRTRVFRGVSGGGFDSQYCTGAGAPTDHSASSQHSVCISMTSPSNSANISGTVVLQAAATATAGATVSSVQFLLDGQPIGSPVTSEPYTYSWTIGSTPLGAHTLSARVTASDGTMA